VDTTASGEKIRKNKTSKEPLLLGRAGTEDKSSIQLREELWYLPPTPFIPTRPHIPCAVLELRINHSQKVPPFSTPQHQINKCSVLIAKG
jgi:hypothetical protein